MPDIDGPITYEIMADDTIAFIDALGIGPAHLVGWSDGANVAMIVAIRRPDLVRKLVVIGTAVNISGAKPWAQALTEHFTVEHLPPMLIDEYAALSPDGRDHFPVVFDKLARAIIDTPQTLQDLAGISAPTLIMAGDDDLVTVEHQEAMRAAVQDGQLAIVPGSLTRVAAGEAGPCRPADHRLSCGRTAPEADARPNDITAPGTELACAAPL